MTLSFRFPAAVLGLVVALAVVVVVAETGSASAPAIQGDANCNGAVDAGDALSILLQMTGAPVANSACALANGDTDCDGDTDEKDALAVLSYVAEHPDAAIAGADCVPIGGLLATTMQDLRRRALCPSTRQGNCAITGGHVYHGAAMPELDGYYIYGDWCSGRIWALDTHNDQSAPIQLADANLHPVSWAITNDGEIVAVSYFDVDRSALFPTPPAGALPGIYKLERTP